MEFYLGLGSWENGRVSGFIMAVYVMMAGGVHRRRLYWLLMINT